ncbi:type III pantothenate kinase [Thermodesulforhabdus norvegica]|uniref:Type III pantothenate kinase n=1 Tax=Thermodesulforhabdus norvegica TaxID=39841 RepID=A0A1I4U4M3_9BACT|nr:type III pantothenate kinase [Thermodesulforhabdus norvegica]SFM83952.1 pantothenate kinase [Thermodesulforhabdus norvegica]
MLLAIDIGNTHTVLGLFKDKELIYEWRLRTNIDITEDEWAIYIHDLFKMEKINFGRIKHVIISCVVPPVLHAVEQFCDKYLRVKPLVVGPGIKTGMPILYENPREVGADRIVNAVAAYEIYRDATVVIDFGTATTFDYISEKGEYLGGAICPGILISCEALFQKASKLPRPQIFVRPKSVLGKNTMDSMNAGIIFGYAGLVEGIVRRFEEEMNRRVRTIATGGLASVIAPVCKVIEKVEPNLTLMGLRILFERNS